MVDQTAKGRVTQKSVKTVNKASILSKMSTKITLLISAIVFAVILVLVIVAESRASKALEDTYLNYAQNLAEEAAIGVDFATEFGEEAYGGYAKNLAQEAAVSINFSREFGESVYNSYAQNLAEEAAMAIDIATQNGPISLDQMNSILGSSASAPAGTGKVKLSCTLPSFIVSPYGFILVRSKVLS